MKAIAAAASGMRHATMAVAEALLVASIAAVVLFAFAPVAKPANFLAGTGEAAARGKTASTVAISVPDGVFGGTTTASTKAGMWVHVTCFVNGTVGMSTWNTTDGTGHATFGLGPTASWTSGGASCTAEVGSFNSRSKFVAAGSTSFKVSAS